MVRCLQINIGKRENYKVKCFPCLEWRLMRKLQKTKRNIVSIISICFRCTSVRKFQKRGRLKKVMILAYKNENFGQCDTCGRTFADGTFADGRLWTDICGRDFCGWRRAYMGKQGVLGPKIRIGPKGYCRPKKNV